MDRALWQETLSKSACPDWPCPICHRGIFQFEKGSLRFEETSTSIRSRDADEFEPDWVQYAFTAWAVCTNLKCKQKFAIGGNGGVAPEYIGDEGDWDYVEYFSPLFCYPMPHIFDIPEKCPGDVTLQLRSAFDVFWANPAACAGRIRVALELLMDHVGVPKRKRNSHGKFSDLTLHGRIEQFAKKEPIVGSQLMAIKWVGNSGSHIGSVERKDILDAFEILEHALKEIIEGRSVRVAKLAKALSKKHSGKG
jgi:Domain of unknown function (DUF4145)